MASDATSATVTQNHFVVICIDLHLREVSQAKVLGMKLFRNIGEDSPQGAASINRGPRSFLIIVISLDQDY